MNSILKQLKKRRNDLGLKQGDLMLRVGVSRQQYQHLESKGNPRLNTLELIAKGLKCELVLIPQENIAAVQAILASDSNTKTENGGKSIVSDDPWKDILEDDE